MIAATPLGRFEIVDIKKNKQLIEEGNRDECLLA